MVLPPITRHDPMAHDLYPLPPPDLTRILEEHLATAFPPDLAFELVLNELVVRAADATGASTAALALRQGEEMICRAAAGVHAPGIGVPLDTHDALVADCLRTRSQQLCADADSDPRVDAEALRGHGIRSLLIVPVFEEQPEKLLSWPTENGSSAPASDSQPELIGLLEVLSPVPNAFGEASQVLLAAFAREVAHVRQAADRIPIRGLASAAQPLENEMLPSFDTVPADVPEDFARVRQPSDVWTLILGALVFLAAAGVSFLVGSRVGLLRRSAPAYSPAPAATVSETAVPSAPATAESTPSPSQEVLVPPAKPRSKQPKVSSDNPPAPAPGELVVYDKGKVIFRMKSSPRKTEASAGQGAAAPARNDAAQIGSAVVPAAENARVDAARPVWLSPQDAQARLVSRAVPQYPPEALAEHLSGKVILEVGVAADGNVSSVRTIRGDEKFTPAATEAVRRWRYQPYVVGGQATPFQTAVTVNFSPSN